MNKDEILEKTTELNNLLLSMFGEKNLELMKYGIKNNIPIHIIGDQGTGKSFFVDYMQNLAKNKGIELKLTESISFVYDEEYPEEEKLNIYWDYIPLMFNGIVIRTTGTLFYRSARAIELFTVYGDVVHEFFSLHKH